MALEHTTVSANQYFQQFIRFHREARSKYSRFGSYAALTFKLSEVMVCRQGKSLSQPRLENDGTAALNIRPFSREARYAALIFLEGFNSPLTVLFS